MANSRNRGPRNFLPRFAATATAIGLLLGALFFAPRAWARPTTPGQARSVVLHWLALESQPLRTPLGRQIKEVETFSDSTGSPAYYVVFLNPSGLVLVSADDLVEPIIGFLPGTVYDPSPTNPLGALVSSDIPGRLQRAREKEAQTQEAGSQALPNRLAAAQEKWAWLENAVAGQSASAACPPGLSDMRVPPFVQSRWSQFTDDGSASGNACYNYFTPPYAAGNAGNYDCGCVATALAQLLRYWQYPRASVGTAAFQISVDGQNQNVNLRGGNGGGGPYDWAGMVLDPLNSGADDTQRQAIGSLTHDAGVAVNTYYSSSGSGSSAVAPANALTGTFGYSNAKFGFNCGSDLPETNRDAMVNPNLQARYPVLFTITGPGSGHEIVCDGYGYNAATMYHHLNMGWAGACDAWYNLPDIDAGYTFNTIFACVYNVYVSGSGEIIAGRVTDAAGYPLSGALVTASSGGQTYSALAPTSDTGVYAIPKVPSNTSYTVKVTERGYSFTPQSVATGTSTDNTVTTGNLWGVDFVGHWRANMTGVYRLLLSN